MNLSPVGRVVHLVAAISTLMVVPNVRAELGIYESFNYSMVELDGQDGGFGWDGPWTRTAAGVEEEAIFDISQDGQSLTSPTYPVSTAGGRLILAGPVAGQASDGGSNEVRINRFLETPFDLAQEGNTMYASFLWQKNISGGGSPANNFEIDFLGGSLANRVRFGSTSGDSFFLNNTDTMLGPLTLEETYFVVFKIEADPFADNLASAVVFDSTRMVPETEPETWDASRTFGHPDSEQLDAVSVWIGRRAGGMFDELRFGSTWTSVTIDEVVKPSLDGDFNQDGTVNLADYTVWRDGLGGGFTVDDYLVWKENFGMSFGSAAVVGSLSSVPEPGTGLPVLSGGLAVLLCNGNLQRRDRGTANKLPLNTLSYSRPS